MLKGQHISVKVQLRKKCKGCIHWEAVLLYNGNSNAGIIHEARIGIKAEFYDAGHLLEFHEKMKGEISIKETD